MRLNHTKQPYLEYKIDKREGDKEIEREKKRAI